MAEAFFFDVFTDYPLHTPKYFLLYIADPYKKQLITAMYATTAFEVMEARLLSLIGEDQRKITSTANAATSTSADESMEVEEPEVPQENTSPT